MLDESSTRSRRAFIWVTTGLALLVVAGCLVFSADVLSGAAAATRSSARFSGLVMAAAVVARAPRPLVWSRRRTELTLSFVAAHGVHYATVIMRAVVEPSHELRRFAIGFDLVVLLGVVLLALIAGTARATSVTGRRANAIGFYVAWTVFVLASALRARMYVASAGVLGALIAAMVWRIASAVTAARIPPRTRT